MHQIAMGVVDGVEDIGVPSGSIGGLTEDKIGMESTGYAYRSAWTGIEVGWFDGGS